MRLSGLVNGAKLELILSSRSPSAVSVALQLQQAGSQESRRLTDKLPSSTSLWMILRHFESKDEKQNFTGRGVTVSDASSLGSGRLYYETPVIQIMSREFSSFVDLQKTLAQLGFNNGVSFMSFHCPSYFRFEVAIIITCYQYPHLSIFYNYGVFECCQICTNVWI